MAKQCELLATHIRGEMSLFNHYLVHQNSNSSFAFAPIHPHSKGQTMTKPDQIKAYVLNIYIQTGKHVFIADLMKEFSTSAAGVRNALGYDDFTFEHDSRWTGSNYAGKYVLAPCVEPSKAYLVKIIKSLHMETTA